MVKNRHCLQVCDIVRFTNITEYYLAITNQIYISLDYTTLLSNRFSVITPILNHFSFSLTNYPILRFYFQQFIKKKIANCLFLFVGKEIYIPTKKLKEKVVKELPLNFVTDIQDEESHILDLTGGKGNSLGLLSSLNSDSVSIEGK